MKPKPRLVPIAVLVSPRCKRQLQAIARKQGIDLNKLLRAALWNQFMELDLADPPTAWERGR